MKVELILKKINEAMGGKLGYTVTHAAKGEWVQKGFLKIFGLTNTDKATLVSTFGARADKFEPTTAYWWFQYDNAEPFANGDTVRKVWDYLTKTGNYSSIPDMRLAIAEMTQLKYDAPPTTEQIKEQGLKKDSLWMNILKSLNSPETQELLAKMSRVLVEVNDKAYGHVMSQGNSIRVYSAKPGATYVATRRDWSFRNRILKPGATPIVLKVKGDLKDSKKDYSQGEKALGIKRADIDKSNPSQVRSLEISSTIDSNDNSWGSLIYFDISDTMLLPGKEDVFVNKPALLDNLQGLLNMAANDEKKMKQIKNSELGIDEFKNDANKTKLFFDRLMSVYKNSTLATIPKGEIDMLLKLNPEDESSVIKALDSYLRKVVYGKPMDAKERDTLTAAAISTILLFEPGVADKEKAILINNYEDKVLKYINDPKMFKEIQVPVEAILRIVKQPYMKESKQNINEIRITPEIVAKAFGIDPSRLTYNKEKENGQNAIEMEEEATIIKENFYNLLNKLNRTR